MKLNYNKHVKILLVKQQPKNQVENFVNWIIIFVIYND